MSEQEQFEVVIGLEVHAQLLTQTNYFVPIPLILAKPRIRR